LPGRFVGREAFPLPTNSGGHGQHAVSDLHLGDLASDSDHFSRKVAAQDERIFDPGELSVIPIRISSSFARQLLPVVITLVEMMDGWSVLLALEADPQSLSFLSDLSLLSRLRFATISDAPANCLLRGLDSPKVHGRKVISPTRR
jgi:hypothetical protein